jgi:hypothetical protein
MVYGTAINYSNACIRDGITKLAVHVQIERSVIMLTTYKNFQAGMAWGSPHYGVNNLRGVTLITVSPLLPCIIIYPSATFFEVGNTSLIRGV